MLPLRFVAGLPFAPLLLLTAACLLIEEQYPFSHFPMYSRFSAGTYYVYLGDGAGRPLPSYTTVGVSTATLKKMYDKELGREAKRLRTRRTALMIDSKRVIAERLLAGFKRSEAAGAIGPLPTPLRIYEVQVRLVGRQLQQEPQLVGEL